MYDVVRSCSVRYTRYPCLTSAVALLLTLLTITWSKDYGFEDIWQRSLMNNDDESYNDPIINEDLYRRSDTINSEETQLSDPKSKKSPVRCTVKKMLRTHPQDGYEYHPRHYHEYECVPVQNLYDNDLSDQDVCTIIECKTLERTVVFARQLITHSSNCSMEPHEKPVKVGCNCVHHIKHQFL